MPHRGAAKTQRFGRGGLSGSALVSGLLPAGPLGSFELETAARVAQQAPILSSFWVWVALIVAFLLLGALAIFLLWANDVPVPTPAALRRAPALVTPRTPERGERVHLPHPSYWPLVLAIAITVIAVGFLTHWTIVVVGILVTVGSIIGWALEPGE